LGDAEIKPENYVIGYGFVTDYLAEIFTRLHRKNYQTIVNANVEFGKMTGRNQDTIKKTSAGLLKLIFPHLDKIDEQIMIIYIDIFGNEKREVKKIKKFKNRK